MLTKQKAEWVGCGENGGLGVEKYGLSCKHFIVTRNAQGLLVNINLETGQPCTTSANLQAALARESSLAALDLRSSPLCTRAGIHKACLHRKTDLKVNSFQTLFKDVFISVYPTFYRTDLSTITVKTCWFHPCKTFNRNSGIQQ